MTKKEIIILSIIGAGILFCYVIAGFYSHPSADDFSYATLGQNDNFIQTVLNERYRWNGRYISNFLVLFSPLNWGGITAYKLMPLVIICFIFFGTSLFYKNIFGEKSILLSFVTTVITFSIMPDITEGIYWYTGAWTYIPSSVIFLIGLSFALKHWKSFRFPQYIITIILFVLASGFNEIISLLGIMIFVIALFKNVKTTRLLFFLALFSSLLVYIFLAPGNQIRSDFFPNNHQAIQSLYMSAAYTLRFIGEWLLNPALVLWGVILLKVDFKNIPLDRLTFLQKPFYIFTALILPTYICCFGPIWSTGILGQYRTPNLASYLFVTTYTTVIIANRKFLGQKIKLAPNPKHVFIALLFFLVLWKNQFFLFKELLNGEIVQFDKNMDKRYELINNCDDSDCFIPEIKPNSKTLFVYSLSNDPEHWQNKSYQSYFKSGRINKIK